MKKSYRVVKDVGTIVEVVDDVVNFIDESFTDAHSFLHQVESCFHQFWDSNFCLFGVISERAAQLKNKKRNKFVMII